MSVFDGPEWQPEDPVTCRGCGRVRGRKQMVFRAVDGTLYCAAACARLEYEDKWRAKVRAMGRCPECFAKHAENEAHVPWLVSQEA